MLTIRLIRTGKKNAPSFRIVVIEKTAPPKGGKFLEILGNYNPRSKEADLKKERIKYWLSQGVQTSETAHNLLVKEGIIKGPKIKKKIKFKKKKGAKKEEPREKQKTLAKGAAPADGQGFASGGKEKIKEEAAQEEVKVKKAEIKEKAKKEEKGVDPVRNEISNGVDKLEKKE